MARERILLMSSPGAGKSTAIIRVAAYLKTLNKDIYVLDVEDKLEATLEGLGGIPDNLHLWIASEWTELKKAESEIEAKIKPDQWVAVDRIDLTWPAVQRWFTQEKYKESLADRMMDTAKKMTKSSMFIPRFDQGSWQVINEQYESFIFGVLYRMRANVLLTSGIKGLDENSPQDIFGNLGVLPRGQKELGHQPNSVFLLHQRKRGRELTWHITTAKDLPGREYYEGEPLFDFAIQYLAR